MESHVIRDSHASGASHAQTKQQQRPKQEKRACYPHLGLSRDCSKYDTRADYDGRAAGVNLTALAVYIE